MARCTTLPGQADASLELSAEDQARQCLCGLLGLRRPYAFSFPAGLRSSRGRDLPFRPQRRFHDEDFNLLFLVNSNHGFGLAKSANDPIGPTSQLAACVLGFRESGSWDARTATISRLSILHTELGLFTDSATLRSRCVLFQVLWVPTPSEVQA